jgi:FAD/FMN-containing dehydrogenase
VGQFLSWGRYPRHPQIPYLVYWPEDILHALNAVETEPKGATLAFGCGRSYGDSCLAESGHVLAMQNMDRVISADWVNGVIFAQAGMTLAQLIRIALPRGWFLPVSPGTKFVTLGGAVANDVHGKNHHVNGTFGRHVKRLVIQRSDEGVVQCSPLKRTNLFAATVGGLGLTGIILGVEIQLRSINSSQIDQRSYQFGGLDEFFDLSRLHDVSNEYAVAWIDCLASGKKSGRGHYIVGNHSQNGPLELSKASHMTMPFDPPISLVNTISLQIFNALYYHRKKRNNTVGYDSFFYPLDILHRWNRIYGRAGFQQYQCVVPENNEREVIREVMQQIAKSGSGSFLAVLKKFGSLSSPGLMSFPMHGVSLALDFPQRDQVNKHLFKKLDTLVHEAGGRLYPAKDAHMSSSHFKQSYLQWEKVEALRDPLLLSQFWKRVTQ